MAGSNDVLYHLLTFSLQLFSVPSSESHLLMIRVVGSGGGGEEEG